MAATLGPPAELADRERAAVESLLFALADDEFVLADRYVEWQVRGPTLEADISVANVAQDELGHARLWYDLLGDFGPSESDLVWERPPGEWRHATLAELPFERGDWADWVVRSYLYDVAEDLRLEALADTSYPRLADRVAKVRAEEHYHREHAQTWLERLCADDGARERVRSALDHLFPHALTLFEPTAREADVVELGVRPRPVRELRADWLAVVCPFLASLGAPPPVGADASPDEVDALVPDAVGRDGSHTEHWPSQHGAFTYTYRALDRSDAPRLMADPDEEA